MAITNIDIMSSVKTEGLKDIIKNINEQVKLAKDDQPVVIGYAAPYAIYVHERMDLHHPNGQAKFLETPLRTMRGQMLKILATTFQKTRSMTLAKLAALRAVLVASQELCPKATGALAASGFVATEANAATVAEAGLTRASEHRGSLNGAYLSQNPLGAKLGPLKAVNRVARKSAHTVARVINATAKTVGKPRKQKKHDA